MKAKALPDTIQAIIEQAGGLGLSGAFTYVGASAFLYQCERASGECRSGTRSRLVTEKGRASEVADVFLRFRVNGKRGRCWTMLVAYEPDDTYTVWLVDYHPKRKPAETVIDRVNDVYCDTLQGVIEHVYDQAIATHNSGFIPLS